MEGPFSFSLTYFVPRNRKEDTDYQSIVFENKSNSLIPAKPLIDKTWNTAQFVMPHECRSEDYRIYNMRSGKDTDADCILK